MLSHRLIRTSLAFGALAVFAACADSPSGPGVNLRGSIQPTASVVGDVIDIANKAAAGGELWICKDGNAAGTFHFDVSYVHRGTGGGPTPPSGALTSLDIDVGTCQLAATTSIAGTDKYTGTITETTQPGWALTSVTYLGNQGTIDANPADGRFGNDAGSTVTFTNTYTPPSTGCTYTKGYYRNHPAYTASLIPTTIHVGNADLSAAQAQAILNATPGKPGNITFSSNNLLNFAQQLISAILNGGASGPASVQSAINSANAHIFIVGGTAITTNLSNGGVSGLITSLGNFNEGKLTGFPHCGGE